ncbi:MAG: hypothetical protein H6865_03745 [Rhodospirillales bacterium]|nr:hypothetical protein [Alphaproteobacteria bacterium]MCB9986730.1 hypothetical protein [Rhodospirillales bacterium]USO08501.1 MAG: hypothetical protein H6866_04640 [Rhodospirillales bacterium]
MANLVKGIAAATVAVGLLATPAAAAGRGGNDGSGDGSRCTDCSGGGGHGHRGKAGGAFQNVVNKTRVSVVTTPNLAVSSGWCMESLSVSLGAGFGGFSGAIGGAKSTFAEACGRWYTMAQGAGGSNCVPALTSVLVAGGKPIDAALQGAVNACYGRAPRSPKPRG